MMVRLSGVRKTILIVSYDVFMCAGVIFDGWFNKSIFVLNSLLHIKQVNSEIDDSDDDPLALALGSLRFLSASQILFAS